MGRKPDVGSLKRERAIALINLNYAVDMSDFPGRVNSAGFARDARKFWNEMLAKHPQLFSQKNKDLIRKQRLAPEVDDLWLRFHGNQRKYIGDRLVHHHVEQGPWAVGLPLKAHIDFYPEVHPWTNPHVLEL